MRQNLYTVVNLDHESFYNFKSMGNCNITNAKVDRNNTKVNWLKIKWIHVTKSDTDTLYFKYRMNGEFKEIKINKTRR